LTESRPWHIFIWLFAITVVLGSVACQKPAPQAEYVAQVFDEYLLRSELASQIPSALSKDDSTKRAKTIINNWVKEQVVLQKAKFNIDDDGRFEALIEDYRNDLLIYEYENQLVMQELDTAVTAQDLEDYYEANRQNFILRDFVVRMRFMVLPSDLEQIDKLTKKFKEYSEKDSLDLNEKADEIALKFIDKPQEWIILESVLKEIPYDLDDFERKLTHGNYVELEKNGKIYLFKIHEFNHKDGISPFQFEKERIRNTLLNQRKLTLLEHMRSELFQEALEKGKIKIKE
jgi:hypothetical protein